MFQSFSGNSRRPRQVNLSGQNVNPFAASGWASTVSGTQKAIAAAQAERQQRQQERLRLNSAKRIQRTWRGHKIRRELAESRRQTWDAMENDRFPYSSEPEYLEEKLRLLLTFFNYQNPEDINRLSRFSDSLLKASQDECLGEELRPRLLKLSQIILAALGK
jgi:ubiquitin-protein ligase E3 C